MQPQDAQNPGNEAPWSEEDSAPPAEELKELTPEEKAAAQKAQEDKAAYEKHVQARSYVLSPAAQWDRPQHSSAPQPKCASSPR